MRNYGLFFLAAVCEIFGCYTFWLWLRLGRSPLWLFAGITSLLAFAVILTRTDPIFAGRAYAAYGGIYIATSLLWLRVVEGVNPTPTDILGSALCLAGAGFIIYGAKSVM